MAMHPIEYKVARTGSRLFDTVMVNAAKRICATLPGLSYEESESELRITGELNDADWARYEEFMFGSGELDPDKL